MPSMKCYECGKVKQCRMVLERDEKERTVAVYYCAPCRRDLQEIRSQSEPEEGGERGV